MTVGSWPPACSISSVRISHKAAGALLRGELDRDDDVVGVVVIIQARRSLVSELTPCPRPRHQTVVLDGLTESLPRAGIG